mgnify:CR=1 FL=1
MTLVEIRNERVKVSEYQHVLQDLLPAEQIQFQSFLNLQDIWTSRYKLQS